jgi:ParB family transcriptional regulator, chromosome partitioning protein
MEVKSVASNLKPQTFVFRHGMEAMKGIEKIPLDKIDLSDQTFSVNFMPDLRGLRSSIEAMGLIQPVILREKGEGYQVVCGFRRVSIAQERGHPDIDARVMTEKERTEFELFSLSLHENLTTRGFNTVEKAISLDKLVCHFQIDPAVAIRTFLPLFSLEPNEKILNTYLSLAQMEDEVKRYVLKEEVSRSNIRALATFTPEDRGALLSLFSCLKLGENRLREMLALIEEISKRDRCQAKEIVGRPEMETFLAQEGLSPGQKAERVKRVLMGLRYPRMERMEEQFEKKSKALSLPSRVSLHHQPYFEGTGLKIEFQFETMEEYRSILSSLSSLADKKDLQEMLESHRIE